MSDDFERWFENYDGEHNLCDAVAKEWMLESWQAALASQEPVGEVTHAEVFGNGATTTNQEWVIRTYKPIEKLGYGAKIFTRPRPDLTEKVKELEAKLELAGNTLEEIIESGLLQGSYGIHERINNIAHKTLRKIGGE
jgi:hypothetical protein